MLPDQELSDLQHLAHRQRLTVVELVRRTLRETPNLEPQHDAESKLNAIRLAASCSFPTTSIEEMLHEIERGYQA